jgi:hypothetical protein
MGDGYTCSRCDKVVVGLDGVGGGHVRSGPGEPNRPTAGYRRVLCLNLRSTQCHRASAPLQRASVCFGLERAPYAVDATHVPSMRNR